MRLSLFVTFAGFVAASCSGQHIQARLSAEPFLSPADVAHLESSVRANPADLDTRLRLLRHYMTAAPSHSGVRSPYRADRMAHVLYLIENLPSDPLSSSALTYVPAETGPWADAADHAVVRNAWTTAVGRHPEDPGVLLNAARFLHREHPEEAEELLSRAVDRDPAQRRVGANLGFLYALDVLGISNPLGPNGRRPEAERIRLLERARNELERSRNVFVLAGAATALPNLFPRTVQARDPRGDRSVFELASRLMARARELDPNEAELKGPMPLIREYHEFVQSEAAQAVGMGRPGVREAAPPPGPATGTPVAVRIGGSVQAAKLVERPGIAYPPEAAAARIEGVVRFNVVIGPDGRVEDATLISGHPLFVRPATDAVRRYRYQPTLLNGAPVRVISQVDVPFRLSN